MTSPLWQKVTRNWRPYWQRWTSWLETQRCKNEIMVSTLITLWQTEEGKVEAVIDFIFLGSKISVENDWSHEIKRYLLLGRKAVTNLENVLKSRAITLRTKVHLVKAKVFPVVTYGCESWTIKKVTDAFELSRWRRLLRVPWKTRILNQSILKEINP